MLSQFPNPQSGDRVDPYCAIVLGKDRRQCAARERQASPVWRQAFSFSSVSHDSKLILKVYHKRQLLKDVKLGQAGEF